MSVAGLVAGLAAFIGMLRLLNVGQVTHEVIGSAQSAVGIMTNPDLSDDEKEAAVRHASIGLFRQFLQIVSVAIAAFGASAIVVWAGSATNLYTLDEAMRVAASWPFLLISSAGAVIAWIALDRYVAVGTASSDAEEVPYSPLDKALHNFAFASPTRQRRLATVETALYRHRIDPARAARPVFVTSLPRAGTTILLQVLARHPELASATYRHMPFTLAPLLWGGFSAAFRKSSEMSERAHGDGIEVGADSPEAFEEMIWMAFWPDHYGPDRIRPWQGDMRNPEFEAFFRSHLAKVVATKAGAARYLSKNNANIARLPLLEAMHPDASIVIPVRNPAAQVASLLRQHSRFCTLHDREPFARQYMEGLGHFEFGAALRPIAFGKTSPDPAGAHEAGFWLHYWNDAYEHVLATAGDRVTFVDHDALCAAPERGVQALAAVLGLGAPEALTAQARMFRPPRPAPDIADVPPPLMRRARELHEELRRRALNPGPALTRSI